MHRLYNKGCNLAAISLGRFSFGINMQWILSKLKHLSHTFSLDIFLRQGTRRLISKHGINLCCWLSGAELPLIKLGARVFIRDVWLSKILVYFTKPRMMTVPHLNLLGGRCCWLRKHGQFVDVRLIVGAEHWHADPLVVVKELETKVLLIIG